MADNTPQDRASKLRQQIAKQQAKLKKIEAAEKHQSRKDDTRRKVILGAFALEHLANPLNKTSPFTTTLYPLLDEYVTRSIDRNLLNAHFKSMGLPELPPSTAANDTGTTDTSLKTNFPKSS